MNVFDHLTKTIRAQLSVLKRTYQFSLLAIFLMSCNSSTLFSDLQKDESVTISLSEYGLTKVPREITQLENVQILTIRMNENEWVIYPPRSAWNKMVDSPPFETLPDEIATMSQLKELNLAGLNLKSLPNNFNQLKNLASLNLAMNKLDISSEIPKLQQLKKLTQLTIYGNKLDTTEIENWFNSSSGLHINYRADE